MSNTALVHATPARLIQTNAALDALGDQIAVALSQGDVIPEAILMQFAEYAKVSKNNVDLLAFWLDGIKGGVTYLRGQKKVIDIEIGKGNEATKQIKNYMQSRMDAEWDRATESGEDPGEKPTEQGNTRYFWVQNAGGKASLVYTNEEIIPKELFYRTVTLHIDDGELGDLEMAQLKKLISDMDIEVHSDMDTLTRNDSAIRKILESGEEVPGAELKTGRSLRWSKPKALPAPIQEEEE